MSNPTTPKSRIVHAPCGPVQGKRFDFAGSHAGAAFLGVPYAKPPVGELRFEKSVPAQKWTNIRECTEFSTSFPYIPPINAPQSGTDEDSLYLNVFTPEALEGQKQPSNLPVLFYIHGGGFIVDGAEKIGDEGICKYLCSKGVIVVTINYRIGLFGFFTLDSELARGNYGMHDMALALRWVKDNIASFGGDNGRITVCGQSAGAAATDLLTLSPHTRDLFQHAIILAGTSNCEWTYVDAALSRRVTVEYAKHLGCELKGTTDAEINREVLDFYKSCDAQKLALSLSPNPEFMFYPDQTFPLGPCHDGDFFPRPLEELRKEAPRKSIINGVTEHEGLLFATIKAMKPELNYKQVVASQVRNIRPDLPHEAIQKCCSDVIDELGDDESHEHVVNCIRALSDIMFNAGALKLSRSRSAYGDKVFNFVFSYYRKGTLGMLSNFLPFEAATHCMELPYLFGTSILGEFRVEEEDLPIIDRFTTYLTTFMKTGDPNNEKYAEKWEPASRDGSDPYFLFGKGEFGTREGFCGGHTKHWAKLFEDNPRKCHI